MSFSGSCVSADTQVLAFRITQVQRDALNLVSRVKKIQYSALMRKLLDYHVVPLAEKIAGDTVAKRAPALADLPDGFAKLTLGQLECLVDLFLQGWSAEHVAKLYGLKTEDVAYFFESHTTRSADRLLAEIRKAGRKERRLRDA